MQIVVVSTEKMNKGSYFILKEQSKEKPANAVYEKIFSVIYWLLKVDVGFL